MGDGSAFGLQQPDRESRDAQARAIIEQILHGTPDGGRVRPEIAEDMRQKLVQHPGDPSRALLAHLKEQGKAGGFEFDAELPEDLDQ